MNDRFHQNREIGLQVIMEKLLAEDEVSDRCLCLSGCDLGESRS